MHWFQGDIAEAVTLSQKNGAIFVVYVEGKCAESEKITKLIDEDQVTNQLNTEHFVAIKIEGGSVAHQQFAEIYKKVNAPSIYFIGTKGIPLEIIESVQDLDDLLSKLESVKLKSGIKFSTPANPSTEFLTHEQTVESENVCKMKTETPTESKIENSPIPDAIDTASASVEEKEVENNLEESKQPELNKEEKIEKAKELIEKNREIKKKEEEEKERLKELERRKMGQDVLKMKRWQEDQEFKQLVEAREKEKKEQQAARQRVLEQIQQDKADRAARFSTQTPTQQTTSAPKTPPSTNVVRIQFKLPDGSAHNHEFTPDTKLTDLKAYIRANITLTFSNFLLATMFPRKEFSDEDDEKTLRDLELYPSAVLLILPLSHGAVSTNSGTSIFSAFMWSVIGPILNLFSYIKGMLFGAPRPKENREGNGNGKRQGEQGETSRLDTLRAFSISSPKRRAGETTTIRRQGNIHRLTDKTDSDDDNNTWNGNSTQQM